MRRYISKDLIKPYLPENPIIVEAGAHKGRDTLQMALCWPQATIHAFEPVQDIFNTLVTNVEYQSNIFCHNVALSNKTGTSIMYVSDKQRDSISSFLKPQEHLITHPHIKFEPCDVSSFTLDDWAQRNNITAIDFLWLDMQGYELLMLQASPHILKTVKVIHTEVNLTERYEKNPLYPELKAWLEGQGFTMVIEAFHHTTWGDVLFVR